jgi:predicted DNA-binding transcriptional regulator AlpA
MDTRHSMTVLPAGLTPRGLSRVAAAAYIGVSPCLFDRLVAEGRMPRPARIYRRLVWDRERLDGAFSALWDASHQGAAVDTAAPEFAL